MAGDDLIRRQLAAGGDGVLGKEAGAVDHLLPRVVLIAVYGEVPLKAWRGSNRVAGNGALEKTNPDYTQ